MAMAFALKAGLFNIGTQGQLIFGAIAAAAAGSGISGLPAYIHMPLTMLTAIAAAGLYGAFQGVLKAWTGAHEVITGIMLNYIAINITDFLTNGPLKDTSPGNVIARTPLIHESSHIPAVHGIPTGFFIALLSAAFVWWLLKQTTTGFEIRTTGAGVDAAIYSGININRTIILTMFISGALAGLGGAIETQSITHRFQPGFNTGLGFEGITIALLGRAHPFGIIPAALLIGAMKAGANQMQFFADVPTRIIDVIQGLILFFVAADVIVTKFIPGFKDQNAKITLTTGWGK